MQTSKGWLIVAAETVTPLVCLRAPARFETNLYWSVTYESSRHAPSTDDYSVRKWYAARQEWITRHNNRQ